MADSPRTIRVISLNCWGLKGLSKYRNERLEEIGHRLAAANPAPEIVGLQECWSREDYSKIRELTQHILPYGKFYFSGVFGAGLVILSKWPIESSSMFQYPLNGRPTAFFRGDWFVGKGVACARIRFGAAPKDIAEVFCTHLHAPYEKEPHDSYICHRTAQAWEISKLMKGAIERGHLALGLGDFNMIPMSLAHRLVEAHGAVNDVWRIQYPDSSIGAAEDSAEKARGRPMPGAHYNVNFNGTTCDSAYNTWRWSKSLQKGLSKGQDILVPDDAADERGKRLDYIFFGDGSRHTSTTTASSWAVESVNVGMLDRHPKLLCSLSDHFSVEATLSNDHESNAELASKVIKPGPQYAEIDTYDEILAMVGKYEQREIRQRWLRISHFFVALTASIACHIGVWWSPHNYVAFILMLISTVWLTYGSVDGLIGFLFVNGELRLLKEFRWEINNAKTLALRDNKINAP